MSKIKMIVFSVVIFATTNALGIEESRVLSTYNPVVQSGYVNADNDCLRPAKKLNDLDYRLCSFTTRTGVQSPLRVRYTKYFNPRSSIKGAKGTIVVAPGRTESSLKYIEVAHDFLRLGYSPVYVIDHRSQGFSDRTLQDTHKVHTRRFDYYVRDFNDFVNTIIERDRSEINMDRLFAISNSMGGGITSIYFAEYDHPFKASALFAAMHKIVYPEPFNEFLAALSGSFICINDRINIAGLTCTGYAPGRGEQFDEADRIFEGNGLTRSWQRYELRNVLWRRYTYLQTGGVTVSWAAQAALAGKKMRSFSNTSKIDIPLQVYTGGEDPISDPEGHRIFCKRAPNCTQLTYTTSRHEILMEQDYIRNDAFNRMTRFFESL
jgi:lysophospholipase